VQTLPQAGSGAETEQVSGEASEARVQGHLPYGQVAGWRQKQKKKPGLLLQHGAGQPWWTEEGDKVQAALRCFLSQDLPPPPNNS
jgi:hypothetical protein